MLCLAVRAWALGTPHKRSPFGHSPPAGYLSLHVELFDGTVALSQVNGRAYH
jgi:hypothetical protein